MPESNEQTEGALAEVTRAELLANDRQLAEYIASKIFSYGHKPGKECQRLAYMVGEYGKSEMPNGGLCKSALIEVITAGIQEFVSG